MSITALVEIRRSPVLLALISFVLLFGACGITPTDATSNTKTLSVAPRRALQAGEYVKVYLSAHQDDWQLYMGDRVGSGLQTVPNVVFIYTTAGDGGEDATFWLPREQAA